jgi:hypothetical protein
VKAREIFNEMYSNHLKETKLKLEKEKEALKLRLDDVKRKKEKNLYEMLYLFNTRNI